MFSLSPLFGRLAARHGPRAFMALGPVVTAAGFVLMTRLGPRAHYAGELLPGVIVFGLGLSATVAPLTAAVLGGVDQRHAGIASAINNAIARVAGLLAVAAVGAIVAARFASSVDQQAAAAPPALGPAGQAYLAEARARPLDTTVPADAHLGDDAARLRPLLDAASVGALRAGLWSMAALLALGGLISAAGISNRGIDRSPEDDQRDDHRDDHRDDDRPRPERRR
jgi:hypothetical protein